MSRQRLDDGTWFDRSRARKFAEDTRWNGQNHVSVATGSQWEHEQLYRTPKGAWVLHRWSQWQGAGETWERIEEPEAWTWLAKNGHDSELPGQVLTDTEV